MESESRRSAQKRNSEGVLSGPHGMSNGPRDSALTAYQALAPVYDDFTFGYQAEAWTERLEAKALRWASPGDLRLLDVGCGTGKSFLPMLRRGWKVVGCDISPAMLAIAREKAADAVLHVADARHLPVFGDFDLAWAVNDTLNYLMSDDELVAALVGLRANLSAGGILLFDLITLHSMREWFTGEMVREVNGRSMRWIGRAAGDQVKPGAALTARFEVSAEPAADHDHCQRHFPEANVLRALERAGLECLEVWGDYEGEQEQPLDEERHEKSIYIARSAI